MVRNYVAKNREKKYSEEDLKIALEAVSNKIMTPYKASQTYNIPLMTIYSRVKGIRGKLKGSVRGRQTAIPPEEEKRLAEGLKTLEKWGFGLTRKEVFEVVRLFVSHNEIQTQFKDNCPGEDWFLSFKKRHCLSIKKPEAVEFARKKMTDPFVIGEYFQILENVLRENELFNKPERIWNLDETSFNNDPLKAKVVGAKNSPSTRITAGSGRDNTTVVAACNAAGGKAPPLIIFKGKNIWDKWMPPPHLGYPGTGYAASKNGWIDVEIFKNYFLKTLIPALGPERPQLVIFDGHSSHVTIDIVHAALKESIIILKLPPHTSHLLQPLDLSVFKSVKSNWEERLTKWQRSNTGQKLPKKDFALLIGDTWLNVSPETLLSGFKKGGIHPFNNNVIPREKFDPAAWERWEHHLSTLSQSTSGYGATRATASVDSTATDPENPNNYAVNSPATPIPTTSTAPSEICLETSSVISGTSPTQKVGFENLLLGLLKQTPREGAMKKKRVSTGAEVITSEESVQRLSEASNKKRPMRGKNTTIKKKKNKPTRKELENDSSSSEDDDMDDVLNLTSDDGSLPSDPENWIDYWERKLGEDENDDVQSFEKSKWVLVKFPTKKTYKYHIGEILNVNHGMPTIKFVKKKGSSKFFFPQVDDISEICPDDIVRILPDPIVERRGVLSFSVSFDSYNLG